MFPVSSPRSPNHRFITLGRVGSMVESFIQTLFNRYSFDSYFYHLKSSPKQGFNHFCSLYKICQHNRIQYLLPKHSMISLVSVDLFLFSKASDAAFLIKADPAMLPSTVGLFGLFNNCKIERNKPLYICQAWGLKGHKYPKTSSNPMSKSKEINRFQENHIT